MLNSAQTLPVERYTQKRLQTHKTLNWKSGFKKILGWYYLSVGECFFSHFVQIKEF